MENPTLILTVDLNTNKEQFIELLDVFQKINNELEAEVKVETEKQVAYINELMLGANAEQRYMICMFLKYPNGVIIPYGYPAFALHETDSIIKNVRACFDSMTYGGMPVAYENNFFTDNKLLSLAVSAMCDIQMLERALAEAEASVMKH
jgi:hypothetical protein